ncbi:two component transcriptional regulator, LytTR family [Chitinophaga sp. CF118]|uniref:LytR/AlgR family response regulator transcription factor n=1 Tax=Chitinophaga sp. CF118 TaxID=1884367 RepID=UPI0008EB5EB9|nr:LytTR family DNA-binding domain-containing protein [Chitinophaga sp. CF118]SFD61883.1 two component transcriptional regulator, LytTR family [Chitinophaga sp. CF118]
MSMSLRVAIIEDEPATARNLQHMLLDAAPEAEVLVILPGVAEAVSWLQQNAQQCDLLFMDIRLSDGLSFEIFSQVHITLPVVFITAFDDYALQAFKANGIDYILKPFDDGELKQALVKFNRLRNQSGGADGYAQLLKIAESLKGNPASYKQSFLVHTRDKLIPVTVAQISWFYTANEIVYAGTTDYKQYVIDGTMEQLQQQLDPAIFFRANRQFIIQRKAILEVDFYFNGRLSVKIDPPAKEQILISKARVPEFKQWMNA